MSWLESWRRFRRRDEADAEQREELEFYLDVTTEELIARGMDPQAAREAARRKLGSPTLIREEIYRMNTWTFLEGLLRDARHALRMIRRNPGFSAAAILSLALGIGANTAIFSVVNAVLIRPLPYPDADALVGVFNSGELHGRRSNDMGFGPGLYAVWRESSEAFEEFGVWGQGAATLTGAGDPDQVHTVTVTQGVLPALGVQPLLGRWFSAEDDTPGTPQTVILSHAYWLRRFGGDGGVLGRQVMIDSVSRQVIGVMPRSFRFLDLEPDVLLPQRFATANLPFFEPFSLSGVARLKPGVTVEGANRDAARILQQQMPEDFRAYADEVQLRPNLRPLKQDVVGDISTVLGVLAGALGLVFLLVCANVANLVLVRAQARTQEFAIRAALGAGRRRIARELLVESLTLGLLGGACGVALAYGAVQSLKVQDLSAIPRLAEVAVDAETLAFALAGSVAASLLFGLIAALQCGLPGWVVGARGASLGLEQLRTQNVLVVAQVALALVLLVASGLLIRSFMALRSVEPGFTRAESVQAVSIAIPDTQVPEPERVAQMQADIVEGVGRLPGVEAVGLTDSLPMDPDNQNGMTIAVEGVFEPGEIPPFRRIKWVSPGLFAAQGTRLLAGRDFAWEDLTQRRRVAIVSESMAREYWGEPAAAVGKRVRPGPTGDSWMEVVGVAEDVYEAGADKPAPLLVYFRTGLDQPRQPGQPLSIRRSLILEIRSDRAGAGSFLREVRAAIHAVNPNLPLTEVRTLDAMYRRMMARTSFLLVLLGVAGSMALTLAVIGVYGVLAYAAGRRRREMSIRVALGARPEQVKGLFVRQGALLACVGCVAGLGAAVGLSRWVSSLLFGVTPLDPATYAAAALAVCGAALAASYLPARQASAVDPAESLRAD
ncbi:MAG: FtsX-like permease family protein [Acidobacteria bacterium]|nr:FtsX-like permease family protein [Acidobacteriota bacterium]